MELDAVVAGLLEVLSGMSEAFDDVLNIFVCSSAGLCEGHAHDVALELDVRGGDGVLLDVLGNLAAGVADLADDKGSVLLGLGGELFEVFEAFAGVF
jgi:hypothetical protein